MNLFITVGSMFPFDRLIKIVDDWAVTSRDIIFAQIGNSSYKPKNMEYKSIVTPAEYRERCKHCDVIISHVGMGTVILASELRKPIIAMPRKPEIKEVTSNHQVATAQWLKDRKGIIIVNDEFEFKIAIKKVDSQEVLDVFGRTNQEAFVKALAAIIERI